MRNPCKECDYYHPENNTCQSKKCATMGDGYVTFIDRLFCEPYKVERKTGKWIDTGSGQECDQCHEIQYGYDSGRRFCANCGAKMEVSG